jgi:hypothetical protein
MNARKIEIYKAACDALSAEGMIIPRLKIQIIGDAIATAQAKIDGAKGGRSGMRSRCKSCRRFVRAGAGDTCAVCATIKSSHDCPP